MEASLDSDALDVSALSQFFADEFRVRRLRFPHSPFVLLTRANDRILEIARAAAEAADVRVVPYQAQSLHASNGAHYPPVGFGVLADLCHILITIARADRAPVAASTDEDVVTLAPEFRVELIRVRLYGDSFKGTYSVTPSGVAVEPSARAMQRTEEFNRYAGAATTESVTPTPMPSGNAIAQVFRTADRLAGSAQKQLRRAFVAIFWIAVLMTIFYGVFSEVSRDHVNVVGYAVAFYFLLLLIAYLIYYIAQRSDIHNRFIEYRALAEGARVQQHWIGCGIARNSADTYLDRHPVELHWIRLALRSAILSTESVAPPPAAMAQAELTNWIVDQQQYFTKSLKRSKRGEKLARYFVIAIFVVGGCAWLVSLLFSRYDPLVPYQSEIGFISIMGSAVAAAVAALVNKLGILYQVRHYSRMLEIYSRAASYLAAGPPPTLRAVAIALGEEALRESGDWLLFRRDRGLDQPASPFRRPSW